MTTTRRLACATLAVVLLAVLARPALAQAGDVGPPCVRDLEASDTLAVAFPGGPRPELPFPEPTADDPYEAAQLGINWLTGALCSWMQTTGLASDCTDGQVKTCVGCHVQAETVLGLARSTTRCYTIPPTPCMQPGDESPLQFAAGFIAGAQRKACIVGPFNFGCFTGGVPADLNTLDGNLPELGSIGHYPPCGSNAGPASIHPVLQSAHGGLNLAGYTTYVSPTYAPNVVALADWFVSKQDASGRWIADRFEAPVDQGDIFCTGAAIMEMKSARPFAGAASVAAYDAATTRAMAWLRTSAPATTQDKLFALLGFLEGGLTPLDADVQAASLDLLDDQNPDGGWSERTGLSSNAYATGQALFGLIEAGLPIEQPAICAGVQWLVTAQNPDGSWSLGISGVSTDASRNDSFTATIWPVLALGSLRPFGAAVTVSGAASLTCDDYVSWPISVTHAADTACGLFARPDTYLLSSSNADGDTTWIEPSRVTLEAGQSAVVRVHWLRSGSSGAPGSRSVTTVLAESEGGRLANCPSDATSTVLVIVPPDTTPGPVDTTMRVTSDRGDLAFTWDALPEAVGGYEIVRLPCGFSAPCADQPLASRLDALAPTLVTGPFESTARLGGEAVRGGPELTYFKVRAMSPCAGTRGATCNFACTDPRRCDASCR